MCKAHEETVIEFTPSVVSGLEDIAAFLQPKWESKEKGVRGGSARWEIPGDRDGGDGEKGTARCDGRRRRGEREREREEREREREIERERERDQERKNA